MALDNYAIVNETTNVVMNICVWDGTTAWEPPEGTFVVKLEPGQYCDIGALYTP